MGLRRRRAPRGFARRPPRTAVATSAISSSSVDTTTRSTCRLRRAWTMVCAMRGIPPTGTRFMRGARFEPPRAGITATIIGTRSGPPPRGCADTLGHEEGPIDGCGSSAAGQRSLWPGRGRCMVRNGFQGAFARSCGRTARYGMSARRYGIDALSASIVVTHQRA